jgi:hypothetical protein
MKSRYDRNPGKEASIANTRARRLQGEHDSADAFVKAEQAKVKGKGGKDPVLKGEALEFDAYMCNNGRHAQELAVKLTAGLDKEAFPVRPTSSE